MPRILHIEDDPANRLLVRKLLGPAGFEVVDAVDGLEGIRKALSEKPDLVLVDIAIPGLDGYEVTLRLRSEPGVERRGRLHVRVQRGLEHRARAARDVGQHLHQEGARTVGVEARAHALAVELGRHRPRSAARPEHDHLGIAGLHQHGRAHVQPGASADADRQRIEIGERVDRHRGQHAALGRLGQTSFMDAKAQAIKTIA
jgi:CheY-like chemotaxis protein